MPVTCYICGRDFGTRSIGIHLPNCQKKWELEQEQLPKDQRRELPAPPQNFDKVLSGEIKGKALVKLNQQAFDEYNDAALLACQFCSRTFLPKSLQSHQKLCTEENPMIKQDKKKTYTSQAKAKVKYPTLKTKNDKNKKKPPVTATNKETVPVVVAQPDEAVAESAVAEENANLVAEENANLVVPGTIVPITVINSTVATPKQKKRQQDKERPMSQSSDDSINTTSKEGSVSGSSNRSSIIDESSEQVGHRSNSNDVAAKPVNMKKRETFVCKNKNTSVSRTELIGLIEDCDIFEEEDARGEVYALLTKFIREKKTVKIRSLLDNPVFEDLETSEEAAEILEEFIKLKMDYVK